MVIPPIICFLKYFLLSCFPLVFLSTTLASLPHGVMLLNRCTAPRDGATGIEKISRKGAPEREQPNRIVVIINASVRKSVSFCKCECSGILHHYFPVQIQIWNFRPGAMGPDGSNSKILTWRKYFASELYISGALSFSPGFFTRFGRSMAKNSDLALSTGVRPNGTFDQGATRNHVW